MTDDELVTKFCHNVQGVLSASRSDAVVDAVWALDRQDNVARLMALTAGDVAPRRARAAAEAVATS
jgi:hypothetical protein